jgi:hypothetical protein
MDGHDFKGWSRKWMADGFILFPPEGRSVGGIRVQDRVRPLRTARTLVDQAVSEGKALIAGITIGPLKRLVTMEGEYGAIITMMGRRKADGAPVERTLGLVYGEDFYSRVDGVIQLESEFESFRLRVKAVARNLSLGLGPLRRRLFVYRPPQGWQGVSRTFRSDWIPRDYPRDHVMIQAFHAKPISASPQVAFERMLREDLSFGLEVEPYAPPEPLSNPHGLMGELTSLAGRYPGGPRLHYDLAVLADPRFLYILRLESGDNGLEEHRTLFKAVVDSVRPLPGPAELHDTAASTHWAT